MRSAVADDPALTCTRMSFSQSVLKKSRLSVDVGSARFLCKTSPGRERDAAGRFRRIHMTPIHLQPCDGCPQPVSRPAAADLLGEASRRVLFTLRQWRERIRGRDELARLDARMLADIGLT